MKRPIRLLFATLTLVASNALAGVEIVQSVETTNQAGMNMKMTVQVEGDRARVDVGDQMSTITGGGTKDITTLMHGQKMAMTIPAAAVEAMKSQVKQMADGADAKPDLEPTGSKEEISGFACEEYTGTVAGMDATYWVTNDVPNQENITKQLSKLAGDTDPFKGAFSDEDFPGFPIRTIVTSPQAGESTVTVESITEKDIPDSAFEVPSDYKSTAMPTIPGMGG